MLCLFAYLMKSLWLYLICKEAVRNVFLSMNWHDVVATHSAVGHYIKNAYLHIKWCYESYF